LKFFKNFVENVFPNFGKIDKVDEDDGNNNDSVVI